MEVPGVISVNWKKMRWRWRCRVCGNLQTGQRGVCKLALFRLLVCWDDLVKSRRTLDCRTELNGEQESEWKSMPRLTDSSLQVIFFKTLTCIVSVLLGNGMCVVATTMTFLFHS